MTAKRTTPKRGHPGGSPVRVQRRRARGWRMPASARYVGRGSRWGNPHPVGKPCGLCGGVVHDRAAALARYAQLVDELGAPFRTGVRRELAGADLACWCPTGLPCHADLLLRIANSPTDNNGSAPAARLSVVDGGGRRG